MISHTAEKMRALVRWYYGRFTPGAVILLYHRIIELPSDPYLLGVSPQHFAEHLAIVRKHYRPISLQQLVNGLRNDKVPRRAIIITFDDGYFDNLINAKPLLEQYDTPATAFVAPTPRADAHEFWWDTLERILLQPRSLPQILRLVTNRVSHEWRLGSAAEYGPDDDARHHSWNYGRKDDPTQRHVIFRAVHQLLKALEQDERLKVLQDLAAWACLDITVRPTYRVLSAPEMVHLAEDGIVDIGAHTMTHPVLSRLSPAKQRAEIQQSKAHLEEILDQPVTSFAYPHGLKADYTEETIAIVRETGFECACAALPGIVRRGVDVHQLPRFVVRDDDGETFAERLSTYFHD
jgi:peptidoglycan/xylan/chitin deacetylase (PgdA/CDA1 family)